MPWSVPSFWFAPFLALVILSQAPIPAARAQPATPRVVDAPTVGPAVPPAVQNELAALVAELDQLYDAAKLHDGLPKAKYALTLAEQKHGTADLRLVAFLRRLGEFHQGLGQFRDAEAHYLRAVKIGDTPPASRGPLASGSLEVGLLLNSLAGLYQTLGRHSEAEPLYVKVLAIFEQLKDKANTAVALRDNAEMYRAQGRFAAAEPLYRRSLSIVTELKDDGEMAILLNDFAGWHRDQARYAEAEALHKRARQLFEKTVGVDHPDFANATNDLAETYRAQGRFNEAEPLYLQALKTIEQQHGADHPGASMIRNNLGELFRALGRFSEAETHFTAAVSNFEKMAVLPQQDLATTLSNLANLFRGQGRYIDAERLYARALAIREQVFGDTHLDLAGTLSDRAGNYMLQGRYTEAEPHLVRALLIIEKIVGPTHPFTKTVLLHIATLSDRLGRPADGSGFRARAAAIVGWEVADVPVLFATNRARTASGQSFVFGSDEKIDTADIAFGRATIRAPKTEVLNRATREAQALGRPSKAVGRQTNEAALRVQRIDVSPDKGSSLLAEARDRLSRATRFPRQAIIYVHGYNNSFDDTTRRAAMISYDLDFDGLIATFAWPARSGVTAYLGDRDRAATAAPFLLEMLETFGTSLPDVRVHIIGHSTGAEVIVNALERLADRSASGPRVKLGEVIFAHADVNTSRLAAMMPSVRKLGVILTSYSSKADWAMSASGWARRDGARVGGAPVYLAGVDAIDISGLGGTFALNHNVFVQNPAVFGDMARLMAAGERPVSKRTPQVISKTTPKGLHWEFRKAAN